MNKVEYEYGWVTPKPSRKERFIRWILRQPKYKFDYTLSFPVSQDMPPGTRIRFKTKKYVCDKPGHGTSGQSPSGKCPICIYEDMKESS